MHCKSQLYFQIIVGWTLVAEKKECSGSEVYQGRLHSIEACVSVCRGVASMFIFGTNDSGYSGWNRCNIDGCTCYCETSAKDEGTCNMISTQSTRLYKYYDAGDCDTLHN